MKVKTTRSVTHEVVLELEECFTMLIAENRVVSVDIVLAHQATDNGEWNITVRGNRVLKSGAFGKRASVTTWEHTRAFSDNARKALFAALSPVVQEALHTMGVSV